MAKQRRNLAKERCWRETLKRQAPSGLSVRGFCGREKLAESVRSADHRGAVWAAYRGAAARRDRRDVPGGSYSQVALESDTVLYRVHGGTSGQLGPNWSRTASQGPLQARMDLALPPGNTAQSVVQICVPQGTTIFEGAAGPNFGQLGGGNQVCIPSGLLLKI